MKQIRLIISLLALCFIISCRPNQGASKSDEIEDFTKFHERFYSDSIFQISRILFPLPGADSDIIYGNEKVEDQENEKYLIRNNKLFWKKEGWEHIDALAEDKEFAVTLEKKGTEIREQMHSRETDLGITLWFSLIDNKWMLTYFGTEWY
jgi:hypothetical protein